MSAREVAVLLSWLSCCCSALWRYYCNSPHYQIFSTRSTIKLEYEGTSFSEWSVPEACHIQDKKLPTTELRCSSSGYHLIKPLVTGPDEEERYLFVDSSYICFLWYYKVEHTKKSFQLLAITIWVYDPENADPGELQRKAEQPSRNSIVLSTQLNTLGQQPTIYTIMKRKIYLPKALDDGKRRGGTWLVLLPVAMDDVLNEIKGNLVTFEDCFVADLFFLLPFPIPTLPETPGFLPLTSQAGSQLITSTIACLPSVAIVVTEMETYQTNDSFQTWTTVRVPPNILSDAERQSVTQVIIFPQGIFFLINNILYLKAINGFKRLGRDENMPDNGIMGIITRKWCWTKYLLKREKIRSTMAIWTENEIYLQHGHLKFVRIVTTEELKNLLNLSPAATLTIQNVAYTGHPLEVSVLLNYCMTCTVTKKNFIMIYNEDSKQWVCQEFTLDVPIDSSLVQYFLFSATPELILKDKDRAYYCYHNFSVIGVLETPTGNGDLSALADGSIVHDVFIDYYGNILVKMENNILFYSKINVRESVKLHEWMSSTVRTAFLLNTSGETYLLSAFSNGTIHAQEYPLNLEVKSISHKTKEKCPYTALQNNINRIFYFLDKGENLVIWSQLIYPENYGLFTAVDYYGPKILKTKEQSYYEIAFGQCTKTLTLEFFQNINYEGADDYFKLQDQNMGLVLIELRPSQYSYTCTRAHKMFQVAVGCDAKKHIAVQGFSKENCLRHDFTYVIERSFLRDRPLNNLKVKYNWEEYGCPLRLDFTEKFHPVIQLFDDTVFVKEVEANFIVWEIHGRDDYSFNNTMKESGCLNEAQTWKSMIELNKHLPLEDVWGPENYRPCFSYAIGKPGDLTQPYEIINRTNNNHILWPFGQSGMYVFRVKILDPNYSFCNLTAIFAIETFGTIPSPSAYVVAAFLFILLLMFFTVLVLSYFRYMTIYRRYIYEPLNKPLGKSKTK
uniref:Catsper channel auxiliary subunit epsilon n=1 Tax=Otolemur garnettii TaxID=30611 RepID=H0WTM2_OTOGA